MSGEAAASMSDLEFGSDKGKEPSMEGRWRGSWYEQFVQPCLVELLGSALFIFIGCLSVIQSGPETGLLQPALAHGLALGLLIATLGNISGAHFNPAVSLAAMLVGGLNLMMLLPYWISQLCGGLIGAVLAKCPDSPSSGASCKRVKYDSDWRRAAVATHRAHPLRSTRQICSHFTFQPLQKKPLSVLRGRPLPGHGAVIPILRKRKGRCRELVTCSDLDELLSSRARRPCVRCRLPSPGAAVTPEAEFL
uniref:Aquaporin 8 n=1 Tax=Molossus molossus TaxID=27622 RepID=A0A7J8IWV5_MOLMO|nr:aquaporin 8 [Molossus molossus]